MLYWCANLFIAKNFALLVFCLQLKSGEVLIGKREFEAVILVGKNRAFSSDTSRTTTVCYSFIDFIIHLVINFYYYAEVFKFHLLKKKKFASIVYVLSLLVWDRK